MYLLAQCLFNTSILSFGSVIDWSLSMSGGIVAFFSSSLIHLKYHIFSELIHWDYS